MLAAGAKAPDFKLDRLEGGTETLAGILERGPALVVLFKISCPVCQLALPYLDRIGRGSLPVIAISQDDERGTNRFREMFRVSMPTLLDRETDGYPVSNAFGITHVPAMFLIGGDGTIELAINGFVKSEMDVLGKRSGVEPFRPGEKVPEWKGG